MMSKQIEQYINSKFVFRIIIILKNNKQAEVKIIEQHCCITYYTYRYIIPDENKL